MQEKDAHNVRSTSTRTRKEVESPAPDWAALRPITRSGLRLFQHATGCKLEGELIVEPTGMVSNFFNQF